MKFWKRLCAIVGLLFLLLFVGYIVYLMKVI